VRMVSRSSSSSAIGVRRIWSRNKLMDLLYIDGWRESVQNTRSMYISTSVSMPMHTWWSAQASLSCVKKDSPATRLSDDEAKALDMVSLNLAGVANFCTIAVRTLPPSHLSSNCATRLYSSSPFFVNTIL